MAEEKSIINKILKYEEFKEPSIFKQHISEFVGTMLLVFIIICASTNWPHASSDTMQKALGTGLGYAGIFLALQHVSNAYVNPAVTIAFMFGGRIGLLRTLTYIIVQILGALVGAGVFYGIRPAEIKTLAVVRTEVQWWQGLLVEIYVTFVFTMVFAAVNDKNRFDMIENAPISLGFTLTACQICAIGFTNGGMNPARSLAPDIILQKFGDHHFVVYWLGPILGSVIAVEVYHFLFKVPDNL